MATNIIIIWKTMIPSTPVGMLTGGMKTMRTPASSPDLDPIEHIWHTLREFLQNEYKPPKRYKAFLESLIPEISSRYIGHLKKTIPIVPGCVAYILCSITRCCAYNKVYNIFGFTVKELLRVG